MDPRGSCFGFDVQGAMCPPNGDTAPLVNTPADPYIYMVTRGVTHPQENPEFTQAVLHREQRRRLEGGPDPLVQRAQAYAAAAALGRAPALYFADGPPPPPPPPLLECGPVHKRSRAPPVSHEATDAHLHAGPSPLELYTDVVDGLRRQFRPPVNGDLARQHFDLSRVGLAAILAGMPQVRSAGARGIIAGLHAAHVAGLRERLERADRLAHRLAHKDCSLSFFNE